MINRKIAVPSRELQLTEVRHALMRIISEKFGVVQNFVITKLIKVFVDIARVQWFDEYPNFIEEILQVGS